jgi:hypothetical protein
MKKHFTNKRFLQIGSLAIFTLISIIAITACQTKTKEETQEKTDSAVLANPTQPELNSDQSALLKTVLGSAESGIIRGVSFGDPVTKVKATETFEMFEETADHLGYTAETAQLESIDVQYFIGSEKKVTKIQVDVYLNSGDATKQLWNAGKSYFSKTYDAPKEENKVITWNKNAVKIQMEDVTKGKDFGLKFIFTPTNKNALASK